MLNLSCSSEPVMRFDYQISLKSPTPLNFLAASAPAAEGQKANLERFATGRQELWQ